jgi:hypothetical protein
MQRPFLDKGLDRLDGMNRPFYLLSFSHRWLGWRTELVCTIVLFVVALFIVMTAGTMDAGLAGFALVYARQFADDVSVRYILIVG